MSAPARLLIEKLSVTPSGDPERILRIAADAVMLYATQFAALSAAAKTGGSVSEAVLMETSLGLDRRLRHLLAELDQVAISP